MFSVYVSDESLASLLQSYTRHARSEENAYVSVREINRASVVNLTGNDDHTVCDAEKEYGAEVRGWGGGEEGSDGRGEAASRSHFARRSRLRIFALESSRLLHPYDAPGSLVAFCHPRVYDIPGDFEKTRNGRTVAALPKNRAIASAPINRLTSR